MHRLVALAMALVAAAFVYSMQEAPNWHFGALWGVSAAEVPAPWTEEHAPADLELRRADGALVRARADHARIWPGNPASAGPERVELVGNVVLTTPEGQIVAQRMEYQPSSGIYEAARVSIRPLEPPPET